VAPEQLLTLSFSRQATLSPGAGFQPLGDAQARSGIIMLKRSSLALALSLTAAAVGAGSVPPQPHTRITQHQQRTPCGIPTPHGRKRDMCHKADVATRLRGGAAAAAPPANSWEAHMERKAGGRGAAPPPRGARGGDDWYADEQRRGGRVPAARP
jgi:hypothetical protein